MIKYLRQMYNLHNDYIEIKRKLNEEIKNYTVLDEYQVAAYEKLIRCFEEKYYYFKTVFSEYYFIISKKVAVLERKLKGIPVIEAKSKKKPKSVTDVKSKAMKSLKQKAKIYNYHPKTKEELVDIIEERIKKKAIIVI